MFAYLTPVFDSNKQKCLTGNKPWTTCNNQCVLSEQNLKKKKKEYRNYDGHDSPVCSSTFHLRVLPFRFDHIHLWYLPGGSYQQLKFTTTGSVFQIFTAIRFDPPLPRYPYTLMVFKVDLSRSSPYLNVKLEFKLKTTHVRVQGVFFWTHWKRHTTPLICKTEFKLSGLQPWRSFGSAFKNPNGTLEPEDTEVLPQKYPSS